MSNKVVTKDTDTFVSGDSYILDMQVWEDQEEFIKKDLTGLKEVVYRIWLVGGSKEPVFETKWKEDHYINIPDLSEGRIYVDLRGDLLEVNQGQFYQRLHIVDESGRKTTILNEYVNIEALPLNNNNNNNI
jgi:hypothetical protein